MSFLDNILAAASRSPAHSLATPTGLITVDTSEADIGDVLKIVSPGVATWQPGVASALASTGADIDVAGATPVVGRYLKLDDLTHAQWSALPVASGAQDGLLTAAGFTQLATNTSNIASNTSAIAGNTSSIGTHTSQIAALQAINAARRDPIWDPPTTPSSDDDEFTVDTILSGAWTATTSGGVVLTRDGAVDLTQACASGHYRSSVINSTLLLQVRQNESILLHKQVAAALSSHSLWILGIGFPDEPGTGAASDPTVSMGLYKGIAGALDFGNRATIRVTSSLERVETVTNIAAGSTVLAGTNSFTLAPLDGLAMRINHGSAAAGNGTGFAFTRSGLTTGYLGSNGPQFNLSTDRIGLNLVSNSSGTPAGVNNAIFALHFLRRAPAAGWIAQA